MKIFNRNIHLLTRFSAALFSIYILLNTKDKLMIIGAFIMLLFDTYTFCKTLDAPNEIWTRVAGFRVRSANHYTMGANSRSGVRTHACRSTMHLKCIPLDQLGHPTTGLMSKSSLAAACEALLVVDLLTYKGEKTLSHFTHKKVDI